MTMLETVVRWVFSLAAACYVVAALALVPVWVRGRGLPAPAEWLVYLAAEAVALGLLVALTLWRLLGRKRLLRLTALVMAPLFALLVIPVGCFVFIPGNGGTIAGAAVFAVAIVVLLGAGLVARTRS